MLLMQRRQKDENKDENSSTKTCYEKRTRG